MRPSLENHPLNDLNLHTDDMQSPAKLQGGSFPGLPLLSIFSEEEITPDFLTFAFVCLYQGCGVGRFKVRLRLLVFLGCRLRLLGFL